MKFSTSISLLIATAVWSLSLLLTASVKAECYVKLSRLGYDQPQTYNFLSDALADAVTNDTIKVAGTCLPKDGESIQLNISGNKTLRIMGGFSANNWSYADRTANSTIIHSAGARTLDLHDNSHITLEGLQIIWGFSNDPQRSPISVGVGTNNGPTLTIVDCMIYNFYSNYKASVLNINCQSGASASVVISNSVIMDNGGYTGYGILNEGCLLEIVHSTLARNYKGPQNETSAADAVVIQSTSGTTRLFNSIISDSETGIAGTGNLAYKGLYFANINTKTSGLTISNSDSPSLNYSGPVFGFFGVDNYHLLAGSPAIDAGLTSLPSYLSSVSFPTPKSEDFEGNPRPIGQAADIGADEYVTPTAVPTDVAPTETPVPTDTPIVPPEDTPEAGPSATPTRRPHYTYTPATATPTATATATVHSDLPDLVVAQIEAPARARGGREFTVRVTLRNDNYQGNNITKPFRAAIYLCRRIAIYPSTDPLLEKRSIRSMKQSLRYSARVKVDRSKKGVYFPCVWVDSSNTIGEANERNNQLRSKNKLKIY